MLPVQSCFCTADDIPRFRSINFYHNKPKIKLKERKFFERWSSALRPPKSPPLHFCSLAPAYGSETWSLREKEMAILRRTERVMIGVKVLDQRNREEVMDILGVVESLDRIAKASSMRWYGLVLGKMKM